MEKKEGKTKTKLGENTLGIAGFVLGVVSIIFAGNNGIIIGIVGLIFSLRQQSKKPTRESKLGVILNIIGIVLAIIILVLFLTVLKPMIEEQFGGALA